MAVAHDAASSLGAASASVASFSWTHTPAGTPKGILVAVIGRSDADKVTGVTYGGVAMTRVAPEAHETGGGDDGRCTLFFLGSGIPTGAQTVLVSRVNDATSMTGMAVSVTALTDTQLAGTVIFQNAAAGMPEENVDDGSPGTNSLRYAAGFTGSAAPLLAGANSTITSSFDFGVAACMMARETTAGQGSRPVGFDGGGSQSAGVFTAITEGASSTGFPKLIPAY